mmetsp:Transcript_29466/g.82289  ORF Transcript_29466/g.82289 Transcript_29466/m.82289 type:complete len:264 (+) Transcript_29466:169-960(+)
MPLLEYFVVFLAVGIVLCGRAHGDVYNSMYSVAPALLNDTSLRSATACDQTYHNTTGVYDYQLCSYPIDGSPFFVFTIHGGWIEMQTSDVTRDMSEDPAGLTPPWSSYYFEGLRSSNNSALHVTATHYDDPTILAIIDPVDPVANPPPAWCVAVHGFSYEEEEEVCVGGADDGLRQATVEAINSAFGDSIAAYDAATTSFCSSIAGQSASNIVNRCKAGLQLEMSSALRSHFSNDEFFRKYFALIVRNTVISVAADSTIPLSS